MRHNKKVLSQFLRDRSLYITCCCCTFSRETCRPCARVAWYWIWLCNVATYRWWFSTSLWSLCSNCFFWPSNSLTYRWDWTVVFRAPFKSTLEELFDEKITWKLYKQKKKTIPQKTSKNNENFLIFILI